MTPIPCPHCGFPMPAPNLPRRVALTPRESQLFAIFKSAGTAGLDSAAVITRFYLDDEIPNSAGNAIASLIHDINKKIAAEGLIIIADRTGPGAIRRLRKLSVESKTP